MIRLAVLLSGRGSNFAAIHEAIQIRALDAQIVAVISNRSDAAGLERAREWGYAAHAIQHKGRARTEHEAEVMRVLDATQPDFIVLAGYMRLLSAAFIARAGRIASSTSIRRCCPHFPASTRRRRQLRHGVKVSGCTVHFVDEALDAGTDHRAACRKRTRRG
jgi:phosphoribosylglycinamide formyltransferase-1